MVYFYVSEPLESSRKYQIVSGKDRFENDLLIKYGYRELNYVWFHVDKFSSGHVYLKLFPDEKSIEDVPREVVIDCLQLCKSMSTQGNKMNQCTIIHTPWHNLRKNKYMKPGEVSFKSLRLCNKVECYARDQRLLNKLAKTRVEALEGVEDLLHDAKKSKDGEFFIRYVADNKDELIEEAKLRKQAKKERKKKTIDDEGFASDENP